MKDDPENNLIKLDNSTRKQLLKKRAEQSKSTARPSRDGSSFKNKFFVWLQVIGLFAVIWLITRSCQA